MTLARFFLLALLFCLGATGLAQAQDADPPVELLPSVAKVELFHRHYLLEDPSASLTLDDVRRPERAQDFALAGTYISSRAPTLWARFTLINRSNAPATWWFDTGNRVSQHIDLYAIDAHGQVQHHSGSSNRSFSARVIPTADFVFPVELPPNQAVELYLRLSSTSSVQTRFVPVIWQPEAYRRDARSETLQWVAYAGVCAALGLLNLMLWIYLRDEQYGAYVGALVGVFMTISFTGGGYGAAHEFLTPNAPVPNQLLMPLSWMFGVSMQCFFVMRLLAIGRIAPRLSRLTIALVCLGWLGTFLRMASIVIESPSVTIIAVAATPYLSGCMAALGLCLVSGFVLALVQRVPLSGYVAVAYMPYLLYGSWIALSSNMFGVTFSWAIAMWCSVFELVVMSLALADRFFQEHRQKLLALAAQERLSRLRRFFSPAVADKLVSDQAEDFMKPRRREIVVVFVDLRGYTAFTDSHSAEDVMQMLGEFHEALGEIIMAHGGTLERFAGDGLMIFFNDPIEIPDPAQQALAMAVAMQKRFAELQTLWETRGYTLAMGIGIAQGIATLGAIGFEGRRDYGAIGGVTNLAARLCGEAKGGQILVSENVAAHASAVPLHPVGPLVLKGFSRAVPTFALGEP